ncbi:hypothetical protein VTJ49DRAFT_4692 [Mycothermus thermophilus]|uniref:Uncharacterized protein n=1 Tax=Humicola insolens TaxID=85995 RepID=A0ABR3V4S7_HUMIN
MSCGGPRNQHVTDTKRIDGRVVRSLKSMGIELQKIHVQQAPGTLFTWGYHPIARFFPLGDFKNIFSAILLARQRCKSHRKAQGLPDEDRTSLCSLALVVDRFQSYWDSVAHTEGMERRRNNSTDEKDTSLGDADSLANIDLTHIALLERVKVLDVESDNEMGVLIQHVKAVELSSPDGMDSSDDEKEASSGKCAEMGDKDMDVSNSTA